MVNIDRHLSRQMVGTVDCVITSPPYVNRMSYIRELRPYMYWLNYLESGRDAGEMDWEAIGGTWGIATSRLADWTVPPEGFISKHLHEITECIRKNNKNGHLMANYVLKYFNDMWLHFQSLVDTLGDEATINYVVGNSVFYDVLVPVEQVYADMLDRLGFSDVKCVPIRKRNSKKQLIEFNVQASWK